MNRILFKKILCCRFRSLILSTTITSFCEKKFQGDGTQYSNWVLARAAGHNHNIQHMKRKYSKDRYSIHRLTNLSFMCDLVLLDHQYKLTMNEKIILLAQMNHVIEVMQKDRQSFHQLSKLKIDIFDALKNPDDLPCLGTLMCSLVSMQSYGMWGWRVLVDAILVSKFDEEYDQLFGVVYALRRYRENLFEENDYLTISKDVVISDIPIIYRNSLEVLRQYVTHNIFNLKECRLLFQALYEANINEGFFWNSVRDWFNIYTKEQLTKKEMDQFFIMKESAIEKVLHDHGIIRPRPILQELSSIVYVLSQFGYHSWRFVEFSQDLILYAMENGAALYEQFKELKEKEMIREKEAKKQQEDQSPQEPSSLNEHIETYRDSQKKHIKQIQKKYQTIFINPIQLKDQFVVNFLVVYSRIYKKYIEKSKKTHKKPAKNQNEDGSQQQQSEQSLFKTSFYDRKEEVYLDPRVKKWIMIQLVKPQMRYTVKQLLQIIRCYPFMEDSQIQMRKFIISKLDNLRNNETNYKEVEQLLLYVPEIHYDHMIPLLSNFLFRNHPSEILKLVQLIQANKWWPYLVQVMLRLPKVVNLHQKYYSFEENCYFLLLLLKDSLYWQQISSNDPLKMQFDGQMQQLKQQIKIVTYSRGFKLTVDSNFHKLMNYIDVVQFFQGGRA